MKSRIPLLFLVLLLSSPLAIAKEESDSTSLATGAGTSAAGQSGVAQTGAGGTRDDSETQADEEPECE